MKRITAILAPLCAALVLLTGCAPERGEPMPTPEATESMSPLPDNRKTDEDFIAAVRCALSARWDRTAAWSAQELAAMSASEYQNYLRQCVYAEEDTLGSIVDYRFLDSDLAALAQQYYYALSLQREGAAYARTGSLNEYNRTWVLGYEYRVAVLSDLAQQYSLRVDEEYASRFAELIAPSYEAKKQIAFHEMSETLPEQIHYEEDIDQSDGTRTCYVGQITNITPYDIKSLSIDVSFLDENGRILYQTSDWISDLRAGQSARSTIFAGTEDYAGMQYAISIYQ